MPVLKASEKFNAPFYNQSLQDYAAAAQGVDLIVTAALCITQTLCVAQAMNVPWVPVMLGPVLPTGEQGTLQRSVCSNGCHGPCKNGGGGGDRHMLHRSRPAVKGLGGSDYPWIVRLM
jgi:hypothetical protein